MVGKQGAVKHGVNNELFIMLPLWAQTKIKDSLKGELKLQHENI